MRERWKAMGGPSKQSVDVRRARLQFAHAKELVRLALISTARYGYYIFGDLMTDDVGTVDFLAVGPLDVTVVVVRSDRGKVTRGDRYEAELLMNGHPFDDDPSRQAQELSADATKRLFVGQHNVSSFICFVHAELETISHRVPAGTTTLWELPWALDPEGEEIQFTPADIEEIAEKVQRVYGRPPIITPNRDRLWEEGV